MSQVALIGFGAIGQEVARLLQPDEGIRIAQIVVPPDAIGEATSAAQRLAPFATVHAELNADHICRLDLLAECAGHTAVLCHVVPALQKGLPCVVTSVGALHHGNTLECLEVAARQGATRVQLIAGAIGGIDALSAAALRGLREVIYVGRKPPRSWMGTPAENVCQLMQLTEPHVIFRGTAREAASIYPQNANVAATVALAGLGLDETKVELFADPDVERNVHKIQASGAFGRLEMVLENRALPDNPKTSALAAFSLARAVRNASSAVFF